ncbi:MAG: phosphatidylserine decarboxylase family protein [Thermodesulfobacteriota bacterium]
MDIKIFKVASEGLQTIFLLAAIGWLLSLFGFKFLSVLFFILTIFVLFFFRDPERVIVYNSDAFVSPADGRVIEISEHPENDYLEKNYKRISIFLSIFDCHINRFPVSGKVLGTKYHPGRFIMAFKKSSSELNEKLSTFIESTNGIHIVLVQVAGFLARRIISSASLDNEFSQGQRFGMIKFGSRVDLYIPLESRVEVTLGQKVRAGETILAWLN